MAKGEIAHIAIELNNSCNQDCVFCYNHEPHSALSTKSVYTTAKKLLKQLYSQAKIFNVTFTGGEPLLEKRLPEIVLFARMNNSMTTIISNGTLFNDEMLQNLLTVKNDLYQLPIHSADTAIHDKMTALPGSHKKSTETLKILKENGANVVAVIVLTKYNIKGISACLDFITDLGIKTISVNRYNIGGKNVASYSDIIPDHQELIKTYKIINDSAKQNGLNVSSNVCTPHCLLKPADFPHIRFGNCASEPLQFPLTVDLKGNLRVCNHSPHVAGNIFKQNIFEILKSDYVTSWNKNIPKFCADCKHWKVCRGGCRAAAEQIGLDNSHPDPAVKLIGKM